LSIFEAVLEPSKEGLFPRILGNRLALVQWHESSVLVEILKHTKGLILAILLSASLAPGILGPLDSGKVNPVHGQTPRKIDELEGQYVSVFPSNLPSTMSSDERGYRGTAAAVQWSEKVEYDGTQEFHTINGSLNFVPVRPYWKAVFINLTAFDGQGWYAEDIRESDPAIASRAGLSVSAVPDFSVRSFAPQTIKSIKRELIHDYLPIKYNFTLEWDERVSARVPVFNSQKIYVILDKWGRATANAQSQGYDVLWILVPPPARSDRAPGPFEGFPFYVDFKLRSRKTAWLGPSQQLHYNYTTGGPVLTETQFLLMWGNHWGGAPLRPYLDESNPDLGVMRWYPRFGISDTQYKDEQWRDQKITHVKISNPPVWETGSVSGPTQATVGTRYSYTVRTTDPDGHRVQYGFEDIYHNGTLTGDLIEANAGATATINVVWNKLGTYPTKIMALDQFGAFSWSPLITVTISGTAVTTTTSGGTTTTTSWTTTKTTTSQESARATVLDTLSDNAPLIAVAAVSIIAACLFVMKNRGVKLSSISQRLTKQLRKE
jgi:hypothetical protein